MRLRRSRIRSLALRSAPIALSIGVLAGVMPVARADAGDDPPPACDERWTVYGVALGATMDEAGSRMSTLGARQRASDTPDTRQIWKMRGEGPAERVVVDAGVDGTSVGTLLQVVVKPEGKSAELLAGFEERWGAPGVSRHIVGGDRPGSMTEASVWIDQACDVKATLLVIKERTPLGFDVRRMGVRLERLIDPLAHLSALRDLVLDPPER